MAFPVLAIGLAVAVAAVTAFTLFQALSGGEPEATRAGEDVATFVTPTGPVDLIDVARISVSASSHLPPAGAITYDPMNAVDGDRQTAWNSDSRQDQGRGETLTFRFSEPVDLKAVRFVNGYAKNADIYSANHRLKSVVVGTDQSSQMLTLLDTSDDQEITYDFGLTSKVVLEVLDVYPGDGFANPDLTADLAVSEVTFLAVQRQG